MSAHANIPIFIPHLGCPNCCVFCNQRTISGVQAFDPESVTAIIEDSLATLGTRECEIAFFGGSFTGIDRALMIRLRSPHWLVTNRTSTGSFLIWAATN